MKTVSEKEGDLILKTQESLQKQGVMENPELLKDVCNLSLKEK